MERFQLVDSSGAMKMYDADALVTDIPGVVLIKYSRGPRQSTLSWDKNTYKFTYNGLLNGVCQEGENPVYDAAGNWLVVDVALAEATSSVSVTIDYEEPSYDTSQWYGFGASPMSSLIFEEIARRTYGEPDLGVLLRQLNILDAGVGAQYLTPKKSELSKETIEPENHIFKDPSQLLPFYDERLSQ